MEKYAQTNVVGWQRNVSFFFLMCGDAGSDLQRGAASSLEDSDVGNESWIAECLCWKTRRDQRVALE